MKVKYKMYIFNLYQLSLQQHKNLLPQNINWFENTKNEFFFQFICMYPICETLYTFTKAHIL